MEQVSWVLTHFSTDPSNRRLRQLPREDTRGGWLWIKRRAGIDPAPTVQNPIVGVGFNWAGGAGGPEPRSGERYLAWGVSPRIRSSQKKTSRGAAADSKAWAYAASGDRV